MRKWIVRHACVLVGLLLLLRSPPLSSKLGQGWDERVQQQSTSNAADLFFSSVPFLVCVSPLITLSCPTVEKNIPWAWVSTPATVGAGRTHTADTRPWRQTTTLISVSRLRVVMRPKTCRRQMWVAKHQRRLGVRVRTEMRSCRGARPTTHDAVRPC